VELIERYLAAVHILLPKAQRDDIITELRDVLTTRCEERAAELGRPLTQDEQERLLSEYGHPVVVAGRYRRQQYLIGPELYPVYTFVVKLVLGVVVAASLLGGIVSAIASRGALDVGFQWAFTIAWHAALNAVAVITLMFAILQRYSPNLRLFRDWRARDIPVARRAVQRRISWCDEIANIVVSGLFVLWWTNVIRISPPMVGVPGQLHVGSAPVWEALYWPMLGIAIATIAVQALRLWRGSGDRLATSLDLLLQLAVLGVAGVALRAGQWISVEGRGLQDSALTQLQGATNLGFEIALIVVVCIGLTRLCYDVWKLSRSKGPVAQVV